VSVCHNSLAGRIDMETAEQIQLILAYILLSTEPTLYFKEIEISPK